MGSNQESQDRNTHADKTQALSQRPSTRDLAEFVKGRDVVEDQGTPSML